MKIAIPVTGNSDNAQVADSFGRATYYFFHDTESGQEISIQNEASKAKGGAGVLAAQLLVDNKVDALITPRCGENAMEVFKGANIKVYESVGNNVKENIQALIDGKLSILYEIGPALHGGN